MSQFYRLQSARQKRKEDAAYSLLGIFDVHMPFIYGEGRKVFTPLQREIEQFAIEGGHSLSGTGSASQNS